MPKPSRAGLTWARISLEAVDGRRGALRRRADGTEAVYSNDLRHVLTQYSGRKLLNSQRFLL